MASGYQLEIDDAPILHRGLGLADLAHVLELSEAGIVSAATARRLLDEILSILDISPADFPYDPVYGDAYNSREREMVRRLGNDAGWLHTGRTRREAGRIAFRLALRRQVIDLCDMVLRFARALVEQARSHAAVAWNDTTYLQPAQPSTFGHYLASFAEQATRDVARLKSAYEWVNRSPGGSGGTAGTSIPVDRQRIAASLGFSEPTRNIRDGMWAVDWLVDVTVGATQSALTADRLAEDLEIFSSPQFGYVRLAGSASRASVLLPQKRNPYALAVIRGGAGTLIGRCTGIMVTQRTPSARTDNWLYAYGEVWRSLVLGRRLIALAADVVSTMEVDTDALTASAGSHFSISADFAEQLVLEGGLDYRSAYLVVSRAVATAAAAGAERLDAAMLEAAAIDAGVDVVGGFEPIIEWGADAVVLALARDVPGGSAPRRVASHCDGLEREIEAVEHWAQTARRAADDAEEVLVARARREE